MKLTNLQILESLQALQSLGAVSLPVKASFLVGRALRKVLEASKDCDSARQKLLEKHWRLDAQGQRLPLTDGHVPLRDTAAFLAEERELHAIEVELALQTVPLDGLGELSLAPNVLAALDWLITESAMPTV